MLRHKLVTQILLILSIINVFLGAPVVVREVCEACANGVDIGEGSSAVSWKRVDEGGDPSGPTTQASQIGSSDLDRWSAFLAGVKVDFSV